MKVIRNRLIPFGRRFLAVNLFGVVFAKGECDAATLNHEAIHTSQQLELAFAGFYVLYALEWLIRAAWLRSGYEAYRAISFEREAYANQHDPDYRRWRRSYAWLRYMKKGRRDRQP